MNKILKIITLSVLNVWLLSGCKPSAYENLSIKERLLTGAADVISFGTYSDYLACYREKGDEDPECKRLYERSLDYGRAWSGAAMDSARYHYGANEDNVEIPTDDISWDWDYLEGSGQWRCRGIQTGQFANDELCKGYWMDDDRWPN